MKKSTAFLLFVAGLATIVASCSSDDDNDVVEEKDGKVFMTFTASQEPFGPVNRTELSEFNVNEFNVNWVEGDKIAVWDETQVNDFNVHPNSDNATNAKISGYATKDATNFTAVYPYDEVYVASYFNGDLITVWIPFVQNATPNSFDPKAAVMVAKFAGSKFSFLNVCSLLKLKTTDAYSKIEVTSDGSGSLAGQFQADTNTGKITELSKSTIVTLEPSEGTTISSGTYYFAIAPGNVTNITINCYTDESTVAKQRAATGGTTYTFSRNTIYNMGSTSDKDWTTP